jgi:hypothetical protein
MNGIDKGACPVGLRRVSVAGFGTLAFAGPVHTDDSDSLWTMGFRFHRGEKEPDGAYHFCLIEKQLKSSETQGIIIKQPAGSMALWRGRKDLHGSSIDIRGKREKNERCSIGCVITQKPLMLNQTLRFLEGTMEVMDLDHLKESEYNRSKLGEYELEALKEYYQGKWS